jgi:antirestriction protein ArdC
VSIKTDKRDERLEALHASLAEGVLELTSSAKWQAWLDFSAGFHTYSFNNQILIWLQCPTATMVTGYRKWEAKGRQVRKGEKSIGIYAPMIRKKTDEVTGKERSYVAGFRIASVFDVSQTDGDALPEDVTNTTLLEGDAPAAMWEALVGVATANKYRVERGECHGANGFTRPSDRLIMVREDVSDAQAFKTLVHEVAHMLLHCEDADLTRDAMAHRDVAEVEAESVAYIVAKSLGLETSPYSLPYVAAWGGKDAQEKITATGQRVVKTARVILDAATAAHEALAVA